MAKLTDTQLVLLITAAKRDGRLLLPFSRTLKLDKGVTTKVVKSLLAKKMIEERVATKDEKDWRSDDNGRYTLVITNAGLEALGIEVEDSDNDAPAPSTTTASTKAEKRESAAAGPKAGGKLDGVLNLVRRRKGASIKDLQEATGWQPQSVRAALTGFRKQGIEINRSKNGEGVTVYTAAQG